MVAVADIVLGIVSNSVNSAFAAAVVVQLVDSRQAVAECFSADVDLTVVPMASWLSPGLNYHFDLMVQNF